MWTAPAFWIGFAIPCVIVALGVAALCWRMAWVRQQQRREAPQITLRHFVNKTDMRQILNTVD